MGPGLRTSLEIGRQNVVTDCTLLVVVLVPLLITHRIMVERTDTAAGHFLAVFSSLGLLLRIPRVLVQTEFPLTAN